MRKSFRRINKDSGVDLKYHVQFFTSCLRAIEGKKEFYERKNAIAELISEIVELGEQTRDFDKDKYVVEAAELQSFMSGIPSGSYGYMKTVSFSLSRGGLFAIKTENGPAVYCHDSFVSPKTIATIIDVFRRNRRVNGPLPKGHRLFGELIVDRVFLLGTVHGGQRAISLLVCLARLTIQ